MNTCKEDLSMATAIVTKRYWEKGTLYDDSFEKPLSESSGYIKQVLSDLYPELVDTPFTHALFLNQGVILKYQDKEIEIFLESKKDRTTVDLSDISIYKAKLNMIKLFNEVFELVKGDFESFLVSVREGKAYYISIKKGECTIGISEELLQLFDRVDVLNSLALETGFIYKVDSTEKGFLGVDIRYAISWGIEFENILLEDEKALLEKGIYQEYLLYYDPDMPHRKYHTVFKPTGKFGIVLFCNDFENMEYEMPEDMLFCLYIITACHERE